MIISSSGSIGWQTTLADLAIILFMLTAADLSNAEIDRTRNLETVAAVATAEPVAIYRPERGVTPFADWLASQPEDHRQRVTILVRHTGSDEQRLIAAGMALAAPAEKAGLSPRLIVERGKKGDVVATLTYDAAPNPVARKLLKQTDQQRLEN